MFPKGSAEIGRLSGPLKRAYASEKGLDYEKLLDATEYKEKYRSDMIRWGEERRSSDPGYFASLVLGAARAPVLVISDARRLTDVQFFKDRCPRVYVVRIHASNEIRQGRGWIFQPGVDDAESECGLDHYSPWDFLIDNEPANAVSYCYSFISLSSFPRP